MNGNDIYSQAADWVVNTARRKPEALLLLAAGCALMMRSGGSVIGSWTSRSDDSYGRPSWQDETADEAHRQSSRAAEGAGRYAGEMRDRVADTASSYASAASDYAQDARRRMSDYTGAVRENLSSATDHVSRTAQSAARTASDTMREQPLVIAALGLAAGAAVAAFFPTTDIERRTLGPAGDALVGAAGAAGRDFMERAARTGEEVRRAAEDGLRDLAHETAESFNRNASPGAANTPPSSTGG
ncbi:MAG: hypothetical protein JO328_11525 [Hyphomicrobiales bacterium]|nr:hypothetical protein [Hyphomicrobiales bacterium]MBV8824615.1 hypothetical protein [Hyphomicrobiales bacterium]